MSRIRYSTLTFGTEIDLKFLQFLIITVSLFRVILKHFEDEKNYLIKQYIKATIAIWVGFPGLEKSVF